jgi:hypothetical protein
MKLFILCILATTALAVVLPRDDVCDNNHGQQILGTGTNAQGNGVNLCVTGGCINSEIGNLQIAQYPTNMRCRFYRYVSIRLCSRR